MSNMASVIGRVAEIRGLVARIQAVTPATENTFTAPLARSGDDALSAFSAALAQAQSGSSSPSAGASGTRAATIGGSTAGAALATLASAKQPTRRAPATVKPAAHRVATTKTASHHGAATKAASHHGAATKGVTRPAATPAATQTTSASSASFAALTGVTAMTETEATTPTTSTSTTPAAGGSSVVIGGHTYDLTLAKDVDPRWADILARDVTYLQAGPHGATSAQDLNPIYAGTYAADVEGRRRADGSLNPIDLPSTKGLTDDQLLLARLAESVPNACLATGQNEGVAKPGATPNANDGFDLLGWTQQLIDMAAGKTPPLVQENGYVWTKHDIDQNLNLAIANIRQNKALYNARWESRWSMLRANGLGDIADAEQKTVQLANVS